MWPLWQVQDKNQERNESITVVVLQASTSIYPVSHFYGEYLIRNWSRPGWRLICDVMLEKIACHTSRVSLNTQRTCVIQIRICYPFFPSTAYCESLQSHFCPSFVWGNRWYAYVFEPFLTRTLLLRLRMRLLPACLSYSYFHTFA